MGEGSSCHAFGSAKEGKGMAMDCCSPFDPAQKDDLLRVAALGKSGEEGNC